MVERTQDERAPRAPDAAARASGLLQWLRSLAYVVHVYAMMALMSLWFGPWAVFDRAGAHAGVQTWCRYARWSARWMVGLDTELRGTVPTSEVLIAAKHQSFLDVIILMSELPRAKFVMKAELRHTPILGWFALRMGCVPVERGRRAEAIRRMTSDVRAGRADPGQLIIYPQGTRAAPGERLPYKVGAAVLYTQSGQPCVPAACNVGLFWPRHGVMRRPGRAVVELLPMIEPGLSVRDFMERIEGEIEATTDRLLAEAGWTSSAGKGTTSLNRGGGLASARPSPLEASEPRRAKAPPSKGRTG